MSRYQADFRPADLFHAGAAGYDAVFFLEPGAGEGMPQRTFAKPVEVQISGSILIYDLADPIGSKGEPVKALAAQFPDMRRFIRERLCAVCLHALRRALMWCRSSASTPHHRRGGWRAAKPIPLPSVF